MGQYVCPVYDGEQGQLVGQYVCPVYDGDQWKLVGQYICPVYEGNQGLVGQYVCPVYDRGAPLGPYSLDNGNQQKKLVSDRNQQQNIKYC